MLRTLETLYGISHGVGSCHIWAEHQESLLILFNHAWARREGPDIADLVKGWTPEQAEGQREEVWLEMDWWIKTGGGRKSYIAIHSNKLLASKINGGHTEGITLIESRGL